MLQNLQKRKLKLLKSNLLQKPLNEAVLIIQGSFFFLLQMNREFTFEI